MRTARLLSAAGVVGAGLLLLTPGLAGAHPKPTPVPVIKSSALAAPFNLAINQNTVYVADGGLNLVGKLKKDGSIATIAGNQPGASGVALTPNGKTIAFTTTVSNPATFENSESGLNIWGPRGKRIYADTHAYETKNNPDKINFYGVKNPSQCVIDALTTAQFPVSYTGQVDSHAYSVAAFRGKWIVADAGANALWKIDQKGKIRTLAVLPPQPTKITPAMAEALKLPDCVAGITYNFEPVPTDVEVGKDGYLYVTTLPGGPESPVLGARGKVWKVNPYSGKAWVIAGGFLGATNLALGRHGEIYVAELFGGRISVVRHGKTSELLSLPGVVAVETDKNGELWAGTLGNEDPPAPGTIVKIINKKAVTKAAVSP
ncbi:MAG TPA: ScyD/ScyE family protein [Microlunatus sp.]|nr:ScyD/ScyE family protein [Microlunatus sp.]